MPFGLLVFVKFVVQFLSYVRSEDKALGLNTLGTTYSPASSQYVLVSSLSWKIVIGPRFIVSSERLEKPGIEPTNPGLEGEYLNHYATEASKA